MTSHAPHSAARQRALRAIALFEAAKGLVALAAVIGLLDLLHHDVHKLALALLWRFHLDPAMHFPGLLLHYADLLSALNLRTLAPLALGYITLRLLEAWGYGKKRCGPNGWLRFQARFIFRLRLPILCTGLR